MEENRCAAQQPQPTEITPDLRDALQRLNPWWTGQPFPRLPDLRRHLPAIIHRKLELDLVHKRGDVAWSDLANHLNETVVQRMLKHDLHSFAEQGDTEDQLTPALLENVFSLACRYAGQAPSALHLAREARRALGEEVKALLVADTLRHLAETLLIRLIPAVEMRPERGEKHDKICLADHSLRASWLQEIVPLDPAGLAAAPKLAPLAGRLAESVVGATLSTVRGLGLAHRPARGETAEIDFMLTIGTRRIPLEVKYQRRIAAQRDTEALRVFLDREADMAPFALLVTQTDVELDDPRIVAIPLASLMLLV